MRSRCHAGASVTGESGTMELQMLMCCRPVKAKYVQCHVTTDDINIRPSTAPAVTGRSGSQRNTWPKASKEASKEAKANNIYFDPTPILVPTPWELERSTRKRHSQRRPRVASRPLPRRIFEQLPREIYHCILDQLEDLHVRGAEVDAIGRQTDLKALLLVNKRWHRAAREHLYRDIWLPSNEELPRRAFSLHRPRSRLKLLLKTLRDTEAYAYMVRHLHVSAELVVTLDALEQPTPRKIAYNLVADIITLLPYLEFFSGYCPLIEDAISTKLYCALATCPRLRAHAWNVRTVQLGGNQLPRCTPREWLGAHYGWHRLETLVICSAEHLDLGPGMVSAVIQQLPSLTNLMLSHLSKYDFHNGTLLSLPSLRSLRLEHLSGITNQGIEHLAYSHTGVSLERLSLIGLEVTSLRAIQALLANLTRLRCFTMVQDTSPEPQPGIERASSARGMESPSLQYLHWDVLVSGSATTMIANSIASGRFPALRKVKVPCDYDGAIQVLCRPIAQEPLDADDLELIERFNTVRYERFLRLSQIQAQLRVHESRQQPSFNVIVHDENKRISATHTIGSYVGSMDSKIEYSLEPDVEGSHYALIDFSDVEAPKYVYECTNEMPRSVEGEQLMDLMSLF